MSYVDDLPNPGPSRTDLPSWRRDLSDPVRAALAADESADPLATPDRVLFTGDWHGRHGWAKAMLRQARLEGADTLVQLGDFGLWHGRDGEYFLNEVARHAAHYEVNVLWLDGNHENFDVLDQLPVGRHGLTCVRPRVWHLPRGFRWTWAGMRFLSLGGATSLDRPYRTPGMSWWPQEELTLAQAHAASAGGAVDVMLTHDCPSGVDVPGLPPASMWDPAELRRANQHRDLLRAVVEDLTPTHLLHGHFHSRYDAQLPLTGGGTVSVTGLSCDGSGPAAHLVLSMEELAAQVHARRAA